MCRRGCHKSSTMRRRTQRFDTGLISKEKMAELPNSPDNIGKGFVLSVDWWVKNTDEMVKRFDAFLQE